MKYLKFRNNLHTFLFCNLAINVQVKRSLIVVCLFQVVVSPDTKYGQDFSNELFRIQFFVCDNNVFSAYFC